MFFFDAREKELVELVLEVIGPDSGPAVALVHALEWLGRVAGAVVDCPALTRSDHEQQTAEVDALGEELAAAADADLELKVPTKAVVGQAYLVAKINFIKAMESAAATAGAPRALMTRLRFELGQSIYSRMAEEIFFALVIDPASPRSTRGGAVRALLRIWDNRLLAEIDDFAPLLESAWEARNRVVPVLGTMVGSHELFRLFQEVRDDRFLDHFGKDDVGEEQTEAFEEFLFGLAHEDIERLRDYLVAEHRCAVSSEEAARILGWDGLPARRTADGPEALYASYKRRKLKASHRALTGAHGPKHTAEEFVMLSFLQRSGAVD
jgi:hypothetical protein